MRTPAVTTRGQEGESYPDFTRRVAKDSARVKAKCDTLNQFMPRCTYCGETCYPIDSGSRCKENNSAMVSRWAERKADVEFYRLGNFGGSWRTQVIALAGLLDRVRAGEVAARVTRGGREP